jgi:hypothetical protein
MSYDEPPDPSPEPSRSRLPLFMVGGILLLVVAFIGGRALAPRLRGDKPAPAASAKTEAAPPPAVSAPEPVATPSATPSETKPRPRKKAEPPPPAAPAAPAAPTTGELHISSDVPGAMVFLDRVYLGTTPVTAKDVTPGSHKLNASADGYDGYSDTIEVAPGPADIAIRFKEVRINESVDVVHKHGVGSCEGRLVADPQGVRYETTNKDDAFSLKYGEVETLEVDYLKKNLRIKRRGGKTWNFTTKAPTADPLFVFHRNVDKVRQQLAGGKTK